MLHTTMNTLIIVSLHKIKAYIKTAVTSKANTYIFSHTLINLRKEIEMLEEKTHEEKKNNRNSEKLCSLFVADGNCLRIVNMNDMVNSFAIYQLP